MDKLISSTIDFFPCDCWMLVESGVSEKQASGPVRCYSEGLKQFE